MSIEEELKRIASGIEDLVKILSQGNDPEPVKAEPVKAEPAPAPRKRTPPKKKEAETIPAGIEIPVDEEISLIEEVVDDVPASTLTENDVRAAAKKLIDMHKDLPVGRGKVIAILSKVAKVDKIFKLIPSQYEMVLKAIEEQIDANI